MECHNSKHVLDATTLVIPEREISVDIQSPSLELVLMEETRYENQFSVLTDISCLPRYKYHRSLLDWFMEGLPTDPLFQDFHFRECKIIIAGNMAVENKKQLFGDTTINKISFMDAQAGTAEDEHTDALIIYFFIDDMERMHQEIVMLRNSHIFENGVVLFVMTVATFNDKLLKSTLKEKVTHESLQVEFVPETHSGIIKEMTCILEKRLSRYLEQTRDNLRKYSSTSQSVGFSLIEVNAILRRLKQSAIYPKPLTEDDEEDELDRWEISEMLKRLGTRILYHEFDGEQLNVITTEQFMKEVQENLEDWYSKFGIKGKQYKIYGENKLHTSDLSETGDPIQGKKIVYVNEGVSAYHENQCFATTGSLMFTSNSYRMVALTCRHALEQVETCYTLIDNKVVTLGKEMPQPNNKMERLHDDIAVLLIDDNTRSIVDKKCEKLLIDAFGLPSPAQISEQDLKINDIVHKRGAKTGFTTGIVVNVSNTTIGNFDFPSTVTFIAGRDSKPFAEKGDSGSLVFKHSLSPDANCLDVNAMVQGKKEIANSTRVVCFSLKDGFDTLKVNAPSSNLKFFDR